MKKEAGRAVVSRGRGRSDDVDDRPVQIRPAVLNGKSGAERSEQAGNGEETGRFLLPQDQKSPAYGLGWDTVDFRDPDFDLGEGVLRKGGNSFQFTSQLIVIPKYNAVLAISETHDCKIDVTQAALHILAQWLLDKQGISIYRRSQAIPQAVSETCCGTYLMPSAIVKVAMQGGTAHFQETPLKAQAYPWETYLRYDGSRWIANEKSIISLPKLKVISI